MVQVGAESVIFGLIRLRQTKRRPPELRVIRMGRQANRSGIEVQRTGICARSALFCLPTKARLL